MIALMFTSNHDIILRTAKIGPKLGAFLVKTTNGRDAKMRVFALDITLQSPLPSKPAEYTGSGCVDKSVEAVWDAITTT